MSKVESFPCKIVSYDEIAEWTDTLAKQIRACNYAPTVIIGLTRGGWVPARLLCDHLHVKKLYAVKTEHWGVTANQDGKALLTQELNVDIRNESVLVVDDITDTGESLNLALSHIGAMGPKELKSATLLHIAHSKKEPDFYSVRVPAEQWTWFIFPWNLHEDLRTLLPKTLNDPRTDQEVVTALKDQFSIQVPLPLVRRTLEDLKQQERVYQSGPHWTAP